MRAESSLARKVVQVQDEALEDVFRARVLAERVDADGVFGDVVDGEVFHWGDIDGGGIHFGSFVAPRRMRVILKLP